MSLAISTDVTPALVPEIATNFGTPASCLDVLPPEMLAQITCYIDGYDICMLYMCGSSRVINSMEARGGVKSFQLEVSNQSRPCFPTIASRLRQLSSFALLSIHPPSTTIDGVDITLLPPTLTRLELQFSNGLSSLFVLPHTDPSSKIRLHNLKSLFPGLRTLKFPLLALRTRQLFSVLPPTIENYTWISFSSKPRMSKLPRSLIQLDLQLNSRALQESVWDEENWSMPPDLASLDITLESYTNTSMLFQRLPNSLTSLTISIRCTGLEPIALWPPNLTSLTLNLRMGVPFTSTAIRQLPRSLTQFTSRSPSLEPEAVLTLPQNLTTFRASFTKDSDSWIPPPTTEDDLKTSDTLLGRFGENDVGHRAILRRLPRSLTKIGLELQEMADRVGYYATLPEGLINLSFRRATDVDLSALPSSLTQLSLESKLLHYGATEQLDRGDASASTKVLWERFRVLVSLRLGAGCRSHNLIISDVAETCPALLKLSLTLPITQPTPEAIQAEQAEMDQLFSVLPSRLRSLDIMLQSRPVGSFKHCPNLPHKLTGLMLYDTDSVRTTSETWKSLPSTLHSIRIVVSHSRGCWQPKHEVPAITKKSEVRTLQTVDRSSSRSPDVDPSPSQGTGKTHFKQSEPIIPRDSASTMLASIFQTCTNLQCLDIHLCPLCEIINEYQLSYAKNCTALRELSLDSSRCTMLSLNIFDLLPSKLLYLTLPHCHPIAEASYPVLKGRLPQLRGITVGNCVPNWFAKEDLSVHRQKMAQLYSSIYKK